MSKLHAIFLELTNECNLNCLHCRASSGKAFPNELTTDEIAGILGDARALGAQFLILTGGEPFLRRDIRQILMYSSNMGFKVLVATNGTLLSNENMRMLSRYGASLQISLDGASFTTHDTMRGKSGSFAKALSAIHLCQREDIDLSVSMTMTQLNSQEIFDLITMCRELGIPTLKIRRFIAEGRGLEKIDDLDLTREETRMFVRLVAGMKERLQSDLVLNVDQAPFQILCNPEITDTYLNSSEDRICGGCSAGVSICVVGAQGDVRPCPSLEVGVGNIREESLSEIWSSAAVLRNLRCRDNLRGRCGECEYRNICGGCRAAAFQASGDYLGEDPKCWYVPRKML